MKEYTIRTYDMDDYENARDSMTPDDIANHLAYINRGYVPDYNFTGDEDDFERYKLHIAISKAIEIIKNKAEQEPKTGHCKDCKWWKDSDGEFRRGVGAESKCPINRQRVFEGNGYCYMFEPQERSDK